MKKSIILLILFFSTVLVISAQVSDYLSFSVFGSAAFEPFQWVKETGGLSRFYTGSGVSWGDSPGMNLNMRAFAPNGKFGATLELAYTNSLVIGENAVIWVKPFDFIRADLGKFKIKVPGNRTNIPGESSFTPFFDPDYQDTGFQAFRGTRASGVLLSITPINNLFIGALVNPPLDTKLAALNTHITTDPNQQHKYEAKDIWRNGQYAVSYIFPKWSVKAQYIGGDHERTYSANTWSERIDRDKDGYPDDTIYGIYNPTNSFQIFNQGGLENPMTFQTAFNFSITGDLDIEAGISYPLPIDDAYVSIQRPIRIYAAAGFTIKDFTIGGRIFTSFLGKTTYDLVGIPHYYDILDGYYRTSANIEADQYGVASGESVLTGFGIGGSLSASYNFDFATVGLDLSLNYKMADTINRNPKVKLKNDFFSLGGALWVSKNFVYGQITTGVALYAPTRSWYVSPVEYTKSPLVITIPVLFSFYL